MRIIHIGLALHLLPDGIRDGFRSKAIRNILALHTEYSAKPEHDGCQYRSVAHIFLSDHFFMSLNIDAMTGGLTIEANTANGIDGSLSIGRGFKGLNRRSALELIDRTFHLVNKISATMQTGKHGSSH